MEAAQRESRGERGGRVEGDQKIPSRNVFGELCLNVNHQKSAVGDLKSGNWHLNSFRLRTGAMECERRIYFAKRVESGGSNFQGRFVRQRGGKSFADGRGHRGDPSVGLFAAAASETLGVERAFNIHFGKEGVGAKPRGEIV